MFCLPFEEAEKIKRAIKSGYLNPDKLNSMTSQERRSFFETIIGKEHAKDVNLLFEKKLLLKNQERAMYDWAREITGLSKEQKEISGWLKSITAHTTKNTRNWSLIHTILFKTCNMRLFFTIAMAFGIGRNGRVIAFCQNLKKLV